MRYILILLSSLFLSVESVYAQFEGYSGYAYAIEKSDVASSETGVIREILVVEGDYVKAGQPLVRLDDEAFRLQVESARHDATNRTEIDAVAKRIAIQEQALVKLKALLASGNARPSEVEREAMELEALKSSHLQKIHDLKSREIQFAKAKAQLEKRTITAPFDGQVAKIHRRVGEFVSPNTPEVATIVDASRLVAEFQIPVPEVPQYEKGLSLPLRIGSKKIYATVDSIGILVDRASQTVTVKVVIENQDRRLRTGTDCNLITPFTGS